jgi:hypothetical protein
MATKLRQSNFGNRPRSSAGDADSAYTGIQKASKEGSVQLGSFDMNTAGLPRIRDGKQLIAIDQQPWLQGFLAVSLADACVNYALAMASAPAVSRRQPVGRQRRRSGTLWAEARRWPNSSLRSKVA